MHKPISLLSLPASLLLLISGAPAHTGTSTHDAQWPYNLPAHAKYYPEDEHLVRRDLEIQDRLAYQIPAGVQKMSGDEGEKFLMTYWRFDFPDPEEEGRQRISMPETRRRAVESFDLDNVGPNATSSHPLLLPFLLHTADEQTSLNNRLLRFPRAVRSSLEKRGFQCPAGTSNCQGIDRPNSCCANGETCQLITDTGLGDVGCCGQGQTCSGRVTTCDAGYTSCPNNPGGGCCIPGYSCVDIGCAISSTSTIVITPTVTASPSPSSSPSSSSPTSSSSPAPTTTSASSSVIAIVPVPPPSSSSLPSPSPSPTPTSSTSAQGSLTCSPGYQSCPATLGGGCCPTDRACGANECPASTSPSQPPSTSTSTSTSTSATTTTSTTNNPAAAAPVRPTSIVSAVTTTSTGTDTVAAGTDTACPTGFYQCSAYYSGGCCRVGRDCGVTSCPTGASSSILVSNGVTVLVASGATVSVSVDSGSASASASSTSAPMTTTVATTTTTAGGAGGGGTGAGGGSCASGWYSCASSNGGGCCPSGYVCGASCTASVSGSATAGSVGKIAASAAAPAVLGRGLMVGIGVWVWVGVVGLFGVRDGL